MESTSLYNLSSPCAGMFVSCFPFSFLYVYLIWKKSTPTPVFLTVISFLSFDAWMFVTLILTIHLGANAPRNGLRAFSPGKALSPVYDALSPKYTL